MSPTLDRDEIAVRLACALIARDGYDDEGAPRDAVTLADALLRSLTPTPAPVAPPAGKYEPRVGDFVTWGSCTAMWRVLRVDSGGVYAVFAEKRNYTSEPRYLDPSECETLRLATPSELAAAGLAVPPPAPTPAPEAKCEMCGGPHVRDVFHAADLQPPAPEAKRPTVDRAYDRVVAVRDYLDLLVSIQPETRRITAALAASIGYVLPAPCPPPVAGRVEKDALRDAESQVIEAAIRWRAAYCGGAGDYINDAADERVALDSAVANLATLRSALSRPVRP